MDKKNYSTGLSILDLLLILFIGLKLCSVITWSWWWVLSPLWISFGLVLVVAITVGVISSSGK